MLHINPFSIGDIIDSPCLEVTVLPGLGRPREMNAIVRHSRGHVGNRGPLLVAGAAVDHRDKKGTTALMHAAQHGHLAVVKRLLVAGADALAQRVDALTGHETARQNGHRRTASVLPSAQMRVSM